MSIDCAHGRILYGDCGECRKKADIALNRMPLELKYALPKHGSVSIGVKRSDDDPESIVAVYGWQGCSISSEITRTDDGRFGLALVSFLDGVDSSSLAGISERFDVCMDAFGGVMGGIRNDDRP